MPQCASQGGHGLHLAVRDEKEHRRLVRRAAVRAVAAKEALSLELHDLALMHGPDARVSEGRCLRTRHGRQEVPEVLFVRELRLADEVVELHQRAGNKVGL